MSADKYAECPVCHGLPEHLRDGYHTLYGKVPIEEYERAKEQYEHRDRESVAVYFEIILNPNGSISLNMSAKCNNCGMAWSHNGVVNCQKSSK